MKYDWIYLLENDGCRRFVLNGKEERKNIKEYLIQGVKMNKNYIIIDFNNNDFTDPNKNDFATDEWFIRR